MNFVYGRSTVAMDTVNDRMRLKDKIIANVAKAVKSIQELHVLSSSGTVRLGNYDWQCHRLCEHLDHTLLHGLRHVTPGYWKIVSEFTHKDCVKQIRRMRNVTTDLGRGRSWLLMALNECLLESYLRCYQFNHSLVEDFYVRDALVRDQDRFNVLLTLISGLENTEFYLDCDVPYLDLCIYPPKSSQTTNVEATVDFDRLSICSMESVHLPTRPLPQTVFEDGVGSMYRPSSDRDSASMGSAELGTGMRESPSLDSGIHSDINYRQRSITPINSLNVSTVSDEVDSTLGDNLEVIHISKKGKSHKSKKKRKKFVSVSSISEPDVGDHYDSNDGPVIEIPPIDGLKLSSAIMNSRNNNDEDIVDVEANNPGKRIPGDGSEHLNDASINNKSATPVTTHYVQDGVVTVEDDIYHEDAGDINQEYVDDYNTLNGKHDNIDISVKNISDSSAVDKYKETEQVSSSFLDQLNAKVQTIIETGKQIETEEQKEEQGLHDRETEAQFHTSNENIRECKNTFEDTVKTRSDILPDNVPNTSSPELVSEIPSIYSKKSDSDLSDNDEDELSLSISSHKSNIEGSKQQCAKSERNTPVSMSKDMNITQRRRSTPAFSGHSMERSQSRGVAFHFSSEIDSTNRKTPDSLSTNQKRSKSVMSCSSISESEEESLNLTNQKPASRPLSGDSTNGSIASRNSPNPLPGNDTGSLHSTTGRSSSDLEGSCHQQQVLQAKVEELIVQRKLNQYTHLTFGEEEMDMNDRTSPLASFVRPRSASLQPGEVELDNNTTLYLMLDVLDSEEEETIVKMFTCHEGHTEGKLQTVYVLVTNSSLYILRRHDGKKKFTTQVSISFLDIDFVSIGSSSQVLFIACKNKRQQYRLTPGDERITIGIVDCLADSMEKCDFRPGRLEVDPSNTIQKVSLQKYITAECKCEASEAEVVCYSLVHWEDPRSHVASCEWDRDGMVFYKSNETLNMFKQPTWKHGYAVLKDGMLCLYHSREDNKPAHFLSLSEGQCVGCKRDFNNDRNNVVKIILQDGTHWSLALETEPEANNWLQCLCQAVSEGLKMKCSRASCIPCCMVVSKFKLLVCHEDLETNFMRTLGSANLHDVSALLTDEFNKSYIVLVFQSDEGKMDNDKWVVYFNCEHECERFTKALSDCWYTHYQVAVPELPVDDFSLQKKCSDMAQHLRQTHPIP
ncbi:pleckstrin homology domain-containing family M member 2-like isoform X2 [Mya arenaria]|uniref:pleckstrin homology domain-containing family M member 2-like isoform X2 n=1 Tax=Mya arenaria TaxID=6604 RepID=UPI0022E4A9F9|nr:pleckstrin homology domain-containing family M member 2-like isoform X2 [Mya arenaria]